MKPLFTKLQKMRARVSPEVLSILEGEPKKAAHPVGDRGLPLEVDPADIIREGGELGFPAQVSPVAGGSLFDLKGKKGVVSGMVHRFGVLAGYEVVIGDHTHIGTCKDFYVGREVLEDVQPPTAMSASVRATLSHWNQQRTYWGTFTDGLELLCFELASATDAAFPVERDQGWDFVIPDRQAWCVVNCNAVPHDNVWTLGVSVYPTGASSYEGEVQPVTDHWARVFIWAEIISQRMLEHGFQWEKAAKSIQNRALATRDVVSPLFRTIMKEVQEVAQALYPDLEDPGYISIGVSKIRLSPGTVGLTEPPTDRRPYTVVSISPTAFKDLKYLKQVVLHECIHIMVQSRGGEPHNERFHALAERLGLDRKYRD
jgi:hypothetical protein